MTKIIIAIIATLCLAANARTIKPSGADIEALVEKQSSQPKKQAAKKEKEPVVKAKAVSKEAKKSRPVILDDGQD